MGQEIITYSQVLTHPFTVSFVCEHCGEQNTFEHEIVGAGKKSLYKDNSFTNKTPVPSQKDQSRMQEKAQKDLDRGILYAQSRLAKGKYSWIKANPCVKCKRYQSWHVSQIWKTFFKTFFGGPFLVSLLVYIPVSLLYGKDSSRYPEWVMIVITSLMLLVMVAAVVNLFRALISRRGKQRNPPTVAL